MKYLLFTLIFSFGVNAAEYFENNGSSPETLTEKSNQKIKQPETKKVFKSTTTTTEVSDVQAQEASPVTSETGIINSSGVTTDDMKSSPNNPPSSDDELLRDATLSNGNIKPTQPGEVQAQEDENALDYSTTPEKRTTKPLGPNKK